MKTVKFTRDYDHHRKVLKNGLARRSTAYKANGGPNKDGVYEVADDVAEKAVADNAATLETQEPATDPAPAPATTTGKPGKSVVTDHANVRG